MDTVKVKYSGPGEDERVLTVSEQEAADLVATGLYRKMTAKKSSSDTKKEGS